MATTIQGTLYKKTKLGWSKRYFQLQSNQLTVWKEDHNQQKGNLKKSYNVIDCKIKPYEQSSSKNYAFSIHLPSQKSKTIILAGETYADSQAWQKAIIAASPPPKKAPTTHTDVNFSGTSIKKIPGRWDPPSGNGGTGTHSGVVMPPASVTSASQKNSERMQANLQQQVQNQQQQIEMLQQQLAQQKLAQQKAQTAPRPQANPAPVQHAPSSNAASSVNPPAQNPNRYADFLMTQAPSVPNQTPTQQTQQPTESSFSTIKMMQNQYS